MRQRLHGQQFSWRLLRRPRVAMLQGRGARPTLHGRPHSSTGGQRVRCSPCRRGPDESHDGERQRLGGGRAWDLNSEGGVPNALASALVAALALLGDLRGSVLTSSHGTSVRTANC